MTGKRPKLTLTFPTLQGTFLLNYLINFMLPAVSPRIYLQNRYVAQLLPLYLYFTPFISLIASLSTGKHFYPEIAYIAHILSL